MSNCFQQTIVWESLIFRAAKKYEAAYISANLKNEK